MIEFEFKADLFGSERSIINENDSGVFLTRRAGSRFFAPGTYQRAGTQVTSRHRIATVGAFQLADLDCDRQVG